MKLHFTTLAVSQLHELGTYHDTTTPAFGIRIGKNRKAWFVIRGRERLRTNIGLYPAISLTDARKEAKRLLTQAPVKGERLTVQNAYDTFAVEHMAKKKARTKADYERLLTRYLLPKLGGKKVAAVSYDDITAITNKLSDVPSEQAHALSVMRIFFRWCVRPPRRYMPHSPLEGAQIKLAKKRKRVLSDPELLKVWRAAATQGYPHGTVVQLLIITGQRKSEIANLRRPWIDEKERTITLPDWLTKNGKEHTFPYGDLIAAVLETVPRYNSTDLLFPSTVSDERPFSGWSKYKRELEDGIDKWTLHDLRRTYRTTHGKIGTSSEVGERLINHAAGVQTDVEAIYDLWKYLPQMRMAVSNFEAHFNTLLAA